MRKLVLKEHGNVDTDGKVVYEFVVEKRVNMAEPRIGARLSPLEMRRYVDSANVVQSGLTVEIH